MSPNPYAKCQKCGASAGLPCITASGNSTKPHAGRLTVDEANNLVQAGVDAAKDNPIEPDTFSTDEPKEPPAKPKGSGLFDGMRKPRTKGHVVGLLPVERGQQLVSPKGDKRRARKAAKRARVLSARGNKAAAR